MPQVALYVVDVAEPLQKGQRPRDAVLAVVADLSHREPVDGFAEALSDLGDGPKHAIAAFMVFGASEVSQHRFAGVGLLVSAGLRPYIGKDSATL